MASRPPFAFGRSPHLASGLLVLVLVLSGCEWALPTHSADGTRHNPLEKALGVEEVGALVRSWEAPAPAVDGTPVVSRNMVVVATAGRLVAYRADGLGDCSGTPRVCQPVWTSSPAPFTLGQPYLIADHVWSFSSDGRLRVFDLAGVEGCAGTPTVCAGVGEVEVPGMRALTVSNDWVYLYGLTLGIVDVTTLLGSATDDLFCEPIWSFHPDAPRVVDHVAVADGIVYVVESESGLDTDTSRLLALQPEPFEGCGGPHGPCEPLWASGAIPATVGGLAVDDGMVVLTKDEVTIPDTDPPFRVPAELRAFSIESCVAAVGDCDPAWTAPLTLRTGLAVADGAVFALDRYEQRIAVRAFDLAGVEGCGGTPRTCAPVRTMAQLDGVGGSTLALANGVLYVGASAFDATGQVGCGGVPTVCAPLRTGPGRSEPIVAGGQVHRVEVTDSSSTLVTEHVVP